MSTLFFVSTLAFKRQWWRWYQYSVFEHASQPVPFPTLDRGTAALQPGVESRQVNLGFLADNVVGLKVLFGVERSLHVHNLRRISVKQILLPGIVATFPY